MKVGDLLEYETRRWLVRKVEKRQHVAVIEGESGVRTIPDDFESQKDSGCTYIANPVSDWPTIAVPIRRGSGPILSFEQPRLNRRTLVFHRWIDWVPADPGQEGGSVFFNPDLHLKIGDFLLAKHKSGAVNRVTVPVAFGTVNQRKARLAPKTRTDSPTVYDRLLDEDEDGDD
jgi:hypothetical protein